jgi:glycosyltransferase involved in cell wall biosynthesis
MKRPIMLQVLYGGLGGHGSVAFSLIQGDQHERMEHSLLFFGIEEARPEYAQQCQELGVPYKSIVKQAGLDLVSWRRVWQELERINPDVVVLHSMSLVPVALAYERLSSSRILYVDHQSNALKRPKEWVMTTMASLLGRRLVVLTDVFSDELSAKLGPLFRREKAFVINNGIDVDRYSPGDGFRGRSRTTISMQSRFNDTKDHATLVRAFANLVDLHPERHLRLVLAGDGATRTSVRELVDELSLTSLVEMPGMLSERELIECLRSTDIYVHSSLGETMSTAVMQAMSAGLAVIGTDVSGISNMVEPNVTGALFPAKDVDRLTALLDTWVGNPDSRLKMGVRAREVALERFSHVSMFERYASLCSSPE